MDIDGPEIIPGEQIRLLDHLENLLKKQLELAHQGDSASEQFNVLATKAGSLVGKMRLFGVVDSGELQYRREKLRKLYENLCLVVAAERADVGDELSRIRRGRKVIGTYRGTV